MRVAITRPKERAEDTIKLIKRRGWEAVVIPAVEIVPRDKKEILSAVGKVEDYDWLVLTSSTGVELMHKHFGGSLKKVKIAAIGAKTKEVLEKRGIKVDLIPKEYKAENLAEEMIKKGIEGSHILVARAAIGREVLVEELKRHARVTEVALYDTEMPKNVSGVEALKGVDAVIFTSSQSVRNLHAAFGEKLKKTIKNAKICAIGPITAGTLKELGIRVDVMPEEYTVEACLEALK